MNWGVKWTMRGPCRRYLTVCCAIDPRSCTQYPSTPQYPSNSWSDLPQYPYYSTMVHGRSAKTFKRIGVVARIHGTGPLTGGLVRER